MSVFPHGEDLTVAVVPMGDASRVARDVVAAAHRETFGASVRVADRAEPPADWTATRHVQARSSDAVDSPP